MKWLTGIKLINWHYFSNETLRIKGCALLTGDNGSGKSTILDAIQFALIGDARKVRFNISAHDETRRNLDGYLRCKTGVEQTEGGAGYLRSGDFTTYIALEFWDDRRQQPFLLGCGIDSYASGDHDPPVFFKLEDRGLSDDLFLDGTLPRSARRVFRPLVQQLKGATVYSSAAQYQADVRAKLGHLSDRFFDLLVKALAFHPITNIRQFVYDYLLDARAINIDVMRENLQQYRHFEELVRQTAEKIQALQAIAAKYDEVRQWEERIALQDYLVLRARREQAAEERDLLEQERKEQAAEAERAARELERLAAERERQQERLTQLLAALAQDSAWQLAQQLDREIDRLRAEVRRLDRQAQELAADAEAEVRQLDEAVARVAAAPALDVPEGAPELARLAEAAHLFAPLLRGEWEAPVPLAALQSLAAAAEQLADRVAERLHEIRTEQTQLTAEASQLRRELEELGQRRLTYPEYVTELRRLVQEEAGSPAQVLAELLEVPDEKWQNAVEGYLNTQRFDLIVPPEDFDRALAIYEQRKDQFRLHTVGLVNTGAVLSEDPGCRPGSLAEEVQTENPHARAYINRIMGRVMKAETEQELKQYAQAITPTCMTYRNHTARQINQQVYAWWYVGARAFARQRELKEARLQEIAAALEQLQAAAVEADQVRQALRDKQTYYTRVLAERWEQVRELPRLSAELAGKQGERAALDLSQVADLQRQKVQAEAALQALETEWQQEVAARATAEAQARVKAEARDARAADWLALHQQLEEFAREQPLVAERGAARYQEEQRSRSHQAIAAGYMANRQTNLTRLDNLKKELTELRSRYNQTHQFGGAPAAADNAAYAAELAKLEESELPAYTEKIAAARAAAEEEFKEHFIYRLQEYINEAKKQLENLNRVLRQISFGQDRYTFACTANASYKAAHDMITDPLAIEGPSLFSGAFRERYQATLDELFAAILDPDPRQSAQNVELYTDYRTYLDFDIRIHHQNGDTTLFSRVLKEKSGGETQTPFYVAIVAAFLQLYRPGNEESARLMLFDEAFNRMDPDRAENTLRFIRQLDLQVLAAAPTDKCEIIAPHMETTLLVIRDGYQTWVEDYHQVLGGAAGGAAGPGDITEAQVAATGEDA